MSKFSTRTVLTATKNNKEQPKPVLATIDKIPPLPPLLVKSKKEVNIISKYFQNKKPLARNKNQVGNNNVKIIDGGLYFYFLFSLYFLFLFLLFSIFRTTWVRVYQSHCHKLMAKSQD